MGLTIPYQSGVSEFGGAGLAPFWDPQSQNRYRNQPVVIVGGASGTGQFGKGYDGRLWVTDQKNSDPNRQISRVFTDHHYCILEERRVPEESGGNARSRSIQ